MGRVTPAFHYGQSMPDSREPGRSIYTLLTSLLGKYLTVLLSSHTISPPSGIVSTEVPLAPIIKIDRIPIDKGVGLSNSILLADTDGIRGDNCNFMLQPCATPGGVGMWDAIGSEMSIRHTGTANCLMGDGSVHGLTEGDLTGDQYYMYNRPSVAGDPLWNAFRKVF